VKPATAAARERVPKRAKRFSDKTARQLGNLARVAAKVATGFASQPAQMKDLARVAAKVATGFASQPAQMKNLERVPKSAKRFSEKTRDETNIRARSPTRISENVL
jgi:hypothetical protein